MERLLTVVSNKATINRIIPFSNVDGYGNRMAVFFQSCPLSCKFCHNPETINFCCHCLKCVETCPVHALSVVNGKVHYDKSLCVDCDTCLKTCPNLASPKTSVYSVEDLWKVVEEYRLFIRGVTVSGGECMVHADFLLPFFQKCVDNGLSCLIDSNGYFNFKKYPDLLSLSEGVMLDVKMWNEEKHLEITGHSNHQIIENLRYLSSINKLAEVRMIMYPTFEKENHETIENVVKIIRPEQQIRLIAYRPFGVREDGLAYFGNCALSNEELMEYKEYAYSLGARNIIIT